MQEVNARIKEAVEKALKEKGLTKGKFCEMLGITLQYYTRFFERSTSMTWEQSRVIEELTGITMEDFQK